MIMTAIILYVIGAVATTGFIGGVRDEMDGIGDMAVIAFWPVALCLMVIGKVGKTIYKIGRYFGA